MHTGINTRALLELFRITASEPDKGWSLRVGMMEIYNDAVYDLLAEARDVGRRPLDVNALAAGELPANMDRWVCGLMVQGCDESSAAVGGVVCVYVLAGPSQGARPQAGSPLRRVARHRH